PALPEELMNPPPKGREVSRNFGQVVEFCLVSGLPPVRMIAILLSAARIIADCLQMAFGRLANPDPCPDGRNSERAETFQQCLVFDNKTFGIEVTKPVSIRPSFEARIAIVNVSQSEGPGFLLSDVHHFRWRHGASS